METNNNTNSLKLRQLKEELALINLFSFIFFLGDEKVFYLHPPS
jgi:hypothetical protein